MEDIMITILACSLILFLGGIIYAVFFSKDRLPTTKLSDWPTRPEEEQVSCDKCKCLILKKDATKVVLAGFWGEDDDVYYCQNDKPNYSKRVPTPLPDNQEGFRYYAECEVTETGKPIRNTLTNK